jgi:hypothetical protein
MEYQLRVCTIKPGAMDEFVRAWRDTVYPLRLEFGFTIVGAWGIEETNTFVWILGYDGPEGFELADAAYYASEARAMLDPDPAQFFEKVDLQWMESVLENDKGPE